MNQNVIVGRAFVALTGAKTVLARKPTTRMMTLLETEKGGVKKIVAPTNDNGHHLRIFQIP